MLHHVHVYQIDFVRGFLLSPVSRRCQQLVRVFSFDRTASQTTPRRYHSRCLHGPSTRPLTARSGQARTDTPLLHTHSLRFSISSLSCSLSSCSFAPARTSVLLPRGSSIVTSKGTSSLFELPRFALCHYFTTPLHSPFLWFLLVYVVFASKY